jgi:hypothetical protein
MVTYSELSQWERRQVNLHKGPRIFYSKIVQLLHQKRPGDMDDLLNPTEKRFSSFDVIVSYFSFPVWLSRFDDKITRGLDVNITDYRLQRERHIQDVIIELVKFRSKDTGNALLDEIDGTGHTVLILPYFNFALYETPLFPALGLNSTAQPVRLRPTPGVPGSDSAISFTPYMWNRDGTPGTSGYSGPGSKADEVLFHELVHATRDMRGVDSKTKVNQGYHNEEEYIAVVLTNIYLAEKNQRDLRANHDGHATLPRPRDFLKNPQHVDMSPVTLLQNFERAQGDFYLALANIPEGKAWWNPVRELDHSSDDDE